MPCHHNAQTSSPAIESWTLSLTTDINLNEAIATIQQETAMQQLSSAGGGESGCFVPSTTDERTIDFKLGEDDLVVSHRHLPPLVPADSSVCSVFRGDRVVDEKVCTKVGSHVSYTTSGYGSPESKDSDYCSKLSNSGEDNIKASTHVITQGLVKQEESAEHAPGSDNPPTCTVSEYECPQKTGMGYSGKLAICSGGNPPILSQAVCQNVDTQQQLPRRQDVNPPSSIVEESNTQESCSPAEEETLHPSPPSFDSQRSRDGSTGSEEQELSRQGSIHKESDANRPMYTELSVNCSVGDQPSKNCSVDSELSKNCSVDEGVELPIGTEETRVPEHGWPTTKALQPHPWSPPSEDVLVTPQQDTIPSKPENETGRNVLVPFPCPSLPLSMRKNIVLPVADIPR